MKLKKEKEFKFLRKIYIFILKIIFFFINGYFQISDKKENFLIKIKKFGRKKYKIFKIDNGRIYLDTSEGRYFYIKENLILKNFSKDTKKLKKNTNIIKLGITKFLKKKNFNVISIVSGRDSSNNYYHWLIDVLPRLLILEDFFRKYKLKHLLVPNYEKKYQIESLNCFFEKKNINFINLYHNKYLQFKSIIFSSDESSFEFYNFKLLKKLKEKILSHIRKKKIFIRNNYKKIYINRIDANIKKDRYLSNENELIFKLKKKGFKSIRLSDYSFFQQALIFNNAKSIIGLHGAGLANILFAKKNTKIIELTNYQWPNLYQKLSKCLNLNYKKILCDKIDKRSNIVVCSIETVLSKI